MIVLRTIVELREHQCRWPVAEIEGEFFFCGCVKQDKSAYCPSHHDRSLKRNEKHVAA